MRRLLVATGLVALTTVGAACSSAADEVKESAVEKLAIGTWHCAIPAGEGQGEAYDITIREGGFTVPIPDGAGRKLTGTWAVDDGDLSIEFTGAAAGAPKMGVDDFDRLTLDSTGFTLSEPGIAAEDAEPDGTGKPVDFDVETHGKDSVTLTIPGGDPWTCDRT